MKKLLLMILILLNISACSSSDDNLSGKAFALLPNKKITLSFDTKDNRFYGQAINNYFGNYKIEQDNITLKLTGSTMMAGDPEDMKKEMLYFQILGKIKKYSLQNRVLELNGDGIKLQFEQTSN